MSLIELAGSTGMKTERRQIPVSELSTFEETGACGTAAVISPIAKIYDPENNSVYEYCRDGQPGPATMKLYNRLVAIQNGDEPDPFGWITVLD
jgi:branched-chain amino acid aminotransferase